MQCKNLSWMGRATLIKSVAQSTPIYTMAAFEIPKSLCERMDLSIVFGGVRRKIAPITLLPFHGNHFVNQKKTVDWGSKNFGISIWPCYPNLLGGY
jgi:hypothetical protein